MLQLNLPLYPVKIIQSNGKQLIFDSIRKKHVVLTPEEWVRQQFIQFLIHEKGYSSSLLSNEVSIELNGTKRRCDTVLYSNTLKPLLIVEYKSPNVEISQQVFDQIVRYNCVLKVPYIIVTNGLRHFCCHMNYETLCTSFLIDIPDYKSLKEDYFDLK
ncbi:MAG TPA: type I restriction enzyme HsdR N-terminal domain-containing protein [Bacteroidales bacterium]